MLAGIMVGLVLLAATVGVLLAARWSESNPACRECAVETELVGEDCTDLGSGWLRAQRVYNCPRCLATFQVDRLIGDARQRLPERGLSARTPLKASLGGGGFGE